MELSKQLSDSLDRLEDAHNPSEHGGKSLKQVDHLKFRSAKIDEQNREEEANIRLLELRLDEMLLMRDCVIREENRLRKEAALKEQAYAKEIGAKPTDP